MGRYLIKRLAWGAITLWGLASAVFFLLRLMPGGPFDDDLALRPEVRASLEQAFGLSQPLWQQYFHFFASVARGDWGPSLYFTEQSVASVVWQSLGPTLALNVAALASALIGGFLFGILPHVWPRTALTVRALETIGFSLPTLFFAPLALWLFCFHWSWFPLRVNDDPSSLVLPIFLLSFRPMCHFGRLLDVRLTEAQKQDFARTHRSLGASRLRTLFWACLRVSLPAFVQQVPPLGAGLLSGSLLIEILFSAPGLGSQFVQSLLNRDWPLALGLTLLFGFFLVSLQIIADVLTRFLDPRLELG